MAAGRRDGSIHGCVMTKEEKQILKAKRDAIKRLRLKSRYPKGKR